MKQLLFFLFVFILFGCNNSQQSVKGIYMGQVLPENTPTLFAPGTVNTGIATRDITFTPNGKEIYFGMNIGNSAYSTILYCKETENGWTQPEVVPFAQNPEFVFIEPFISPDGDKLFFVSNKGNEFSESNKFITDIWVAERENDFWGEPHKLDSTINSPNSEFFPSVAKNGNLYFTREDNITRQGFIYKSEFKNGKYQSPVKLPEQINAGIARFNSTISNDESFMIIPLFGMPDSYGKTDYYISFFEKEYGWSNPLNLGEKINTPGGNEYSASFSPDGKYFFFMSARTGANNFNELSYTNLVKMHNSPENGNSNIYWMKSDFIQDLKEKATFTKNNKR